MGGKTNTTSEVEGGTVGVVESDEVVEVGNLCVLIIEKHTVLVFVVVVGHSY